MKFEDYYATLGVPRDAAADAIKKAYRKLAMQWHPDRHRDGDAAAAEAKFKRISEAYEVLSDPKKRQRYDQLGADWERGMPPGADTGTMDPDEFAREFGGNAFSDFFTRFFGDDLRRQMHERAARHPRYRQRGADVQAALELDLDDLLAGGRRSFTLDATAPCSRCGGAGSVGERVCATCAGVGAVRQRRTVDVKIPSDARPGTTLRLRGLGEPGDDGAEVGDLLLTLAVRSGPVYRLRDGADVEADVPIAPWEAAAGAEIAVRTPRGQAKVRIPAGTTAGSRLRLRGQGLADASGNAGDFFVVVRLALPGELTPRQLELLREMGKDAAEVEGGARQRRGL